MTLLKRLKIQQKKQRGEFLGMLLGALGADLLGNMLVGKGVIREGDGGHRVFSIFNATSSFD